MRALGRERDRGRGSAPLLSIHEICHELCKQGK